MSFRKTEAIFLADALETHNALRLLREFVFSRSGNSRLFFFVGCGAVVGPVNCFARRAKHV